MLRKCQEEAVEKLTNTANELLGLQGNKTIVFKAPTGSGKTVMMGEFLKRFVEKRTDGKTFSFLWTAPRQLHIQSKEKLEKYYEDTKALRCVYFEDLSDKKVNENEILYLNWESINKADNIYIRDNEQDFNLTNIVQNTIDDSRIIILVIDESHHTAGTETSQSLIQMLRPKITVEVSATPHLQGDETVNVYREKVIEEGMIKKRIVINPDFKNIITNRSVRQVTVQSEASETTNEFVIKTALAKREALANAFEENGSNVNPLILIQLPDRRRGTEDVKDEIIEILKENHSITVENGKLAVYLSEDKENLEMITRNDSSVEVMIFKQAVALGWDCPRASVLALFRAWRSITFSIQTVGRILRMPEHEHYDNDELNTGFVYTNLSDIAIQEDVAGNYLTIQYAKRKEVYQNIELRSVHSKRSREMTRLSPKFVHYFTRAAEELDLKNRISTNATEIQQKLISDGLITDPDEVFEHLQDEELDDYATHKGATIQRVQADIEVQNLFDHFIIENLSPFYPESRSVGRLKESIYRFFKTEFPKQFEYYGVDAQVVVLDEENKQHFINAISQAKQLYQIEVEKIERGLVTAEESEVPISHSYSDDYVLKQKSLSIFEPYYERKSASQPEKDFADFLDNKSEEIVWWFKNGEREKKFFAVPYTENDQAKPFYVDWIVKYKDGRVGLFDTKAGITAETAKSRAEGLAKYIKEENEKGRNLFGGIVILKDGSWWLNDNEVYGYDENNLIRSGWRIFY